MSALKNPRHERFAQELAKGETQEQAYVNAGYRHNKSAASRLGSDVNIRERVAQIQERGAIRAEVTIQTLTEELDAAMRLAIENGQASAVVSAVRAKAEINGLLVHRTENKNTNQTADSLNDAELERIAAGGRSGVAPKAAGAAGPDRVH